MRILAKAHFLRKAWRYRLHSEKFSVAFLMSRNLTNCTALDIGANLGIYSYWMHKKVGTQGTVIGFEPQPELHAHLNQVRVAFGLRRLRLVNMGLSSTTTIRELVRPHDHWGGASLESRPHSGADVLKVNVQTLDEYLQNQSVPPVGFIKCDVEGHEFDVFQGACKTLESDRPDIAFECGNPADPHCQTFALLDRLDYDCLCFWKGGFASVSRYSELRKSLHRKATCNFVAVPREKSVGELRRSVA